jgi:hypothetical protein
MLERINPVLRMLCLALAALLLYQFARVATRKHPLASFAVASTMSSTEPPGNGSKATNTLASYGSTQPSPPLSPALQTRIDRITQSEIFAPIVRPLPMALLGIAGKDAFVRAPNGQTGLLKEGEELGGLKLLKIGTNRILIEHEQQKKELLLFSGFGSDTLLPKGDKNTQ